MHETFPKLLLFLFMAIPAIAYVVIRSLSLVRHGKAAQLAKAFGLSAGEVPLRFGTQWNFRPRLSGVLEGRRVELYERNSHNRELLPGKLIEDQLNIGQRVVPRTAFRLVVAPTLSQQLSARRKHLGRRMLAKVGASAALKPLSIPLLDAKMDVEAFTESDREVLQRPGVQNALLLLVSWDTAFRFADGELRVDWEGAFSEPQWRQLLTLGAQLARALNQVEDSSTSELAAGLDREGSVALSDVAG